MSRSKTSRVEDVAQKDHARQVLEAPRIRSQSNIVWRLHHSADRAIAKFRRHASPLIRQSLLRAADMSELQLMRTYPRS